MNLDRIERDGARAYHMDHPLSIIIPEGWELRNFYSEDFPDVIYCLAPPATVRPAIQVSITGVRHDASIDASREIAFEWVRRNGCVFGDEYEIQVDGHAAYGFTYMHDCHPLIFWKWGITFVKVVVTYSHWEVLIQLESKKSKHDYPLFNRFLKDFRFAIKQPTS